MATPLNPLETLILLSADEEGRIPFPTGSASMVESKMKIITELERRGYFRRRSDSKIDRSYVLTDSGRNARLCLAPTHEQELEMRRGVA